MLEVKLNYQLTDTYNFNFVKESLYVYQTNYEKLDCIGKLVIGQAGYLLKQHRI